MPPRLELCDECALLMLVCDSSLTTIRPSALNCLFGEVILAGVNAFEGDVWSRFMVGVGMEAVSSSHISNGNKCLLGDNFCGEGDEPRSIRSAFVGDMSI